MKPLTLRLGLILLLSALPLSAQVDDVVGKLKTTVRQVLSVLEDTAGEPEARRVAAVRAVIGERFSYQLIARGALGRGWTRLDANQQEQYVDLFTDLVVTTYMDRYTSDEPPAIEWGEVTRLSEKRLEVESSVMVGGSPATVVYRLLRYKGDWQVYNLTIEGVSLVGNYREQFAEILNRGGPEAVLQTLREKLENA
ncbi:MAG: MlaC/ttg2D family ABC transporter substrate-binding protein [Opitutales bacterium]